MYLGYHGNQVVIQTLSKAFQKVSGLVAKVVSHY